MWKAASFFCLFINAASAQDLRPFVVCGEPNGRTLFFEGGIVAPGLGGERPDGMRGGQVRFFTYDGAFSVATRDTSEEWTLKPIPSGQSWSYKKDDGGIVLDFTFIDREKHFTDNFMLNLNSRLAGTLVWQFTQAGPFTKASVLTATCRASVASD